MHDLLQAASFVVRAVGEGVGRNQPVRLSEDFPQVLDH